MRVGSRRTWSGREGPRPRPRQRVALATPVAQSADYLESRRGIDGGVSEPGGRADASLTAWTILALRAVGRDPGPACP